MERLLVEIGHAQEAPSIGARCRRGSGTEGDGERGSWRRWMEGHEEEGSRGDARVKDRGCGWASRNKRAGLSSWMGCSLSLSLLHSSKNRKSK